MINKIKKIEGNIYGMGVYCFKTSDGKVLYVGSGMMNDRLSAHLHYLKRYLYQDTNKAKLQKSYDMGELIFEVLFFSVENKKYKNMSVKEKEILQEELGIKEKFYIDLYKDTICNKQLFVTKSSSNRDNLSTFKRIKANTGNRNPNVKYSEQIIAEILWLKMNAYKPKEIEELYKEYGIKNSYIYNIGFTKWMHLDPIKPSFLDKKETVNIGVLTALKSNTLASV